MRVFSGAPWEEDVGYCRALRVGSHVFVSGTAPIDADGAVVAPDDGYAQAKRCLQLIAQALAEFGAGLDSVVRTRMYVTDVGRWDEFGRAHREAFAAHPPVTSMIQVSSLIDPAMLIEIEADALLPK